MMKERILLVSCHGLGAGGVQAVMMNIVRSLSDIYTFDIVLFTDEKRHYDDEFLSYGGQIFRLPHYSGKNKLRKKLDYYLRGNTLYKQALALIKDNGPYKAIHCHNAYESALFVKAAHKNGVPIRVTHSHTILFKNANYLYKILSYFYLKILKKYATNFVGCSDMSCESMFGKNTKYTVIPNHYDDARFSQNPETINKERPFVLCQTGRFDSNKNQLFSLSVLHQIKQTYPNVKMHFIGFNDPFGEDYIGKMKAYISENDLIDNVQIHDRNIDIPTILENSCAFLLPSHNEGFGIVLIEAQAMGLRCYASDSIPRSTNVGGCKYLSIKEGTNLWAKEIIKDYEQFNGKHASFDCSKFTLSYVNNIYKKLYCGERI